MVSSASACVCEHNRAYVVRYDISSPIALKRVAMSGHRAALSTFLMVVNSSSECAGILVGIGSAADGFQYARCDAASGLEAVRIQRAPIALFVQRRSRHTLEATPQRRR